MDKFINLCEKNVIEMEQFNRKISNKVDTLLIGSLVLASFIFYKIFKNL